MNAAGAGGRQPAQPELDQGTARRRERPTDLVERDERADCRQTSTPGDGRRRTIRRRTAGIVAREHQA